MLKLKISWEEVREKIKENNIDLTDEDLVYNNTANGEKALLEHLAKKMNKSPEEIKDWIESVAFNKGQAS